MADCEWCSGTAVRELQSAFPFDQNVMRPLCLMVFILIEREFPNILNGGFLTDHSEPLGLVFDMPLCMLALWHLLRFLGSD